MGGPVGLSRQSLLLISVLQNMVRHQKLHSVRHQDLRLGYAALHKGLQFLREFRDIESHAVSDHVRDVRGKHAGGQQVQSKAAVLIDDGMARVGSPLEPDNNIRLLGKHIRDLAFSFIAPVCSYDRFYRHMIPPCKYCCMLLPFSGCFVRSCCLSVLSSDTDLRLGSQFLFVLLQHRAHGLREIFGHLLRASSHVSHRIHGLLKIGKI